MSAILAALLRSVWPYLLLAVLLAGAAWWVYSVGHATGAAGVQSSWDDERRATEKARTREVAEAKSRLDKLHGEIEVLRSRPERIRTVLETIHVPPDDLCRSAPDGLRRLWDAEPGAAADLAPAGAAGLRDGGMPTVAEAGR